MHYLLIFFDTESGILRRVQQKSITTDDCEDPPTGRIRDAGIELPKRFILWRRICRMAQLDRLTSRLIRSD